MAEESKSEREELGRRELGMTPEQWEPPSSAPAGEQDENGADLSLLRENFRLTPTERLEKHQQALRMVQEIRRAARPGQTASDTLRE